MLQEDSLVNSVGKDIDLSNGKVARVISHKAGPQLQVACSALAPLNVGDVKETDSFQLHTCKKILHCLCPQWRNSSTAPVGVCS